MQVYDSLGKAEEFPAEKLAYFDVEGGEDLLHEMRFLPVAARPAVAEYIVDNGLDATVCKAMPLAPHAWVSFCPETHLFSLLVHPLCLTWLGFVMHAQLFMQPCGWSSLAVGAPDATIALWQTRRRRCCRAR